MNGALWKLAADNDRVGAALSQQMRDEARYNEFRHNLDRVFEKR